MCKLDKNTEVLGWAAAEDRNGYDYQAFCHMIVTRPSVQIAGLMVAGAACNKRVRTSGQVHKELPTYAPSKCKSCEKIEGRLRREGARLPFEVRPGRAYFVRGEGLLWVAEVTPSGVLVFGHGFTGTGLGGTWIALADVSRLADAETVAFERAEREARGLGCTVQDCWCHWL